MKNIKKIILSAVIGLPLLFSQEAFADHYRGNDRSNHYKRGKSHHHVRPNNAVGQRTTYTTRHGVYRSSVVHRHVHYRPHYRPVVAHYHTGHFDPCYETVHYTGPYWNINLNSGGFGIGVQSGW